MKFKTRINRLMIKIIMIKVFHIFYTLYTLCIRIMTRLIKGK